MARNTNLFNESEEALRLTVPEEKDFDSAKDIVLNSFNKDQAEEICNSFCKRLPALGVELEGDATRLKSVISLSFNKNVKKKDDMANILAALLSSEDNLRIYLNLLPEGSRKLFTEVVKRCYVPVVEAKKMSRLSLNDTYYYSSPRTDREFTWLSVTRFDRYSYPENIYYVYFKPAFYVYFLKALMPEAFSKVKTSKELDGDNWTYCNFEKDVFRSVPLIDGLFLQGVVTPGRNKLLTATVEKKIAQLGIPDFEQKEMFENLRVHLMASYIASVSRDGYEKGGENSKMVKDEVRKVVTHSLYAMQDYFNICLPYIKGIKKSITDYNHFSWLIKYVNEFFSVIGKENDWISIQAILVHAYSAMFPEYNFPILAYSPNRYNIGAIPENSYTVETINPGNILYELTLPFIRSYIYLLASFGILDVAEDKNSKGDEYSPFGALAYCRLTNLGDYAFGITKTYEEPEEEKKVWFELDDERLIFRSLSDDNPYIVILKDVSNSIGGGRYEVTAESFLSHCTTRADVEQKIEIFKEYIGRKLPKIWKDFFDEMLRHCQPLEKQPITNYKMYRVDKDNIALQRLLTTDEKLRSLVIRAEGYRILVDKKDLSKFENRLKSFGYLL